MKQCLKGFESGSLTGVNVLVTERSRQVNTMQASPQNVTSIKKAEQGGQDDRQVTKESSGKKREMKDKAEKEKSQNFIELMRRPSRVVIPPISLDQ